MDDLPSGVRGYAEVADAQIKSMESVVPLHHAKSAMHLFPRTPCEILDVGAGTGRDAAALAGLGHTVVAVEPLAEFLEAGKRFHPSANILWVQDSLPSLKQVDGRFDVILAQAVWMHLDHAERRRAMERVSSLMNPGAVFLLTLRHGPVPQGKIMYAVGAEETIRLGVEHGLELALHEENQPSAYSRTDVTWTRIALTRKA